MSITYVASATTDISAEDKTVEVVYTNDSGLTHTRNINVPRNEDGSVDDEYYQEILEGQFLGLQNKIRVGSITFVDPNASEEPTE